MKTKQRHQLHGTFRAAPRAATASQQSHVEQQRNQQLTAYHFELTFPNPCWLLMHGVCIMHLQLLLLLPPPPLLLLLPAACRHSDQAARRSLSEVWHDIKSPAASRSAP
jgi:hypothetical protein